MKKFIAVFLSVFLLLQPLCASAVVSGETASQIVSQTIDDLYDERRLLCLDFEQNRSAIAAIDAQLETLGVEELSAAEVAALRGESFGTMATVPATGAVKWTSERVYTVYCGLRLQYQIIRGVPNAALSPLEASGEKVIQFSGNSSAANLIVAKAAVIGLSGALPKYGILVSTTLTAFDVLHSVFSELQPETIITNLKSVYMYNLVSEEKYVYVKCDGDPDMNNQILCYKGNAISYEVLINIPQAVLVNGSYGPNIASEALYGSAYADHYNNAHGYAVEMYFYGEYLRQRTLYNNFLLTDYEITALTDQFTIPIPSQSHLFPFHGQVA